MSYLCSLERIKPRLDTRCDSLRRQVGLRYYFSRSAALQTVRASRQCLSNRPHSAVLAVPVEPCCLLRFWRSRHARRSASLAKILFHARRVREMGAGAVSDFDSVGNGLAGSAATRAGSGALTGSAASFAAIAGFASTVGSAIAQTFHFSCSAAGMEITTSRLR